MKYLKNSFAIIFFLVCSQQAISQQIHFQDGLWMPKHYISELKKTDKQISKNRLLTLLKPIEAILIQNRKMFVKTYKDEFKPSEFIFIYPNKILLKTVMINLAQPTISADPAMNKFSKSRFYLYRAGKDSIYLIVKSNSSSDTIPFIRCPRSLEGL